MKSVSNISKIEYTLLKCLSHSLRPSDQTGSVPYLTEREWGQILAAADRHEVLPLLENILEPGRVSGEQWQFVQFKTARTVYKEIQLQVLNAGLTALLEKEGIKAVTLKGCALARFYPVPEFRKTTDIDLFVDNREDAERAVQILTANGFKASEEWHANHHVVLTSQKKEVVELHTAWTEFFKEEYLNRYLEKLQRKSSQHCRLVDCQGLSIYAYDTAWQGFYLLVHMLQHFVGSGFGLRNLCDWVVLWENCDDAKARKNFWKMVCDSRTAEFAKAVTAICVTYLGLNQEKSPVPASVFTAASDSAFSAADSAAVSADREAEDALLRDALLRDILDAGEFGYSEVERMVGMDGNSLTAYVREFHHQMHINFPKAGRMPLFWPVLWLATLVRFLKNNKRLNRAPISAIMKKAGERGKLAGRLLSYERK